MVPIPVEVKDGYGGTWRRNLAEQATNSSLTLLAAQATTRRDPLHDFELYKGGWNITDKHYWAVSIYLHSIHYGFES